MIGECRLMRRFSLGMLEISLRHHQMGGPGTFESFLGKFPGSSAGSLLSE